MNQITNTLNEFGKATGCTINTNKSVILSNDKWSPQHHDILEKAGWPHPEKNLVEDSTYLGILVGRNVTINDIARNAYNKFKKEMSTWKTMPLTISRRTEIFNIFLLPIFQYTMQFYLLPEKLLKKIDNDCMSYILGATTILQHDMFCHLDELVNIRKSLRNSKFINLSALLKEEADKDNELDKHLPKNMNTNCSPEQHKAKAKSETENILKQDPRTALENKTIKKDTQKDWYDGIKNKHYQNNIEKITNYYGEKLNRWKQHSFCALENKVILENIKNMNKDKNIKERTKLIHLLLICNAWPTARKTNYNKNNTISKCKLCGKHEDSVEHYFYDNTKCNTIGLTAYLNNMEEALEQLTKCTTKETPNANCHDFLYAIYQTGNILRKRKNETDSVDAQKTRQIWYEHYKGFNSPIEETKKGKKSKKKYNIQKNAKVRYIEREFWVKTNMEYENPKGKPK